MRRKFMRFPQGKTKVVTLSYDDCIEEDEFLIQLMEKYKIKGTFNLIPAWFAQEGTTYPEGESYRLLTASAAKKLYSHPLVEVANHGYEHKYMTTLTTWEMAEEMQKCRQALETMFGRIVKGMAYPYGWYDEKLKNVLAMSGVTYSRTVESTLTFDFPDDWLQWHPTCHHDYPQLSELTKQFVDMKVTEWPKMFYLWGHTFEFEDNDNWWVMENFMKAVSGREDIWYATNGEIYDYVKAYENLDISADGKRIVNPAKFPVWVEIDGDCHMIEDELVIS